MKNKINIVLVIIILIIASVLVYLLIDKQSNKVEPMDNTIPVETSAPDQTTVSTVEETEESHEHVYTETITTEATCETNGLKTLTCECGDTYTEELPSTGHVFGEFIYNEDATYFEDGTQTAKCKNCEATDTGTAYGSKLKYTFTDMDKTMYVQQSVNVRNLPCTDGEKQGSLSTNEEVRVTGQCVETGWYRIEFNDYSAYVSNNYLGTSKVKIKESFTTQKETNNYIPPNAPPGALPGEIPGEYSPNLIPGMGGDGGEIVGNVQIKPAGD